MSRVVDGYWYLVLFDIRCYYILLLYIILLYIIHIILYSSSVPSLLFLSNISSVLLFFSFYIPLIPHSSSSSIPLQSHSTIFILYLSVLTYTYLYYSDPTI
jgi:hypothetical protein